MDLGQNEIREVVQIVWESVLGWDIQPKPAQTQPDSIRGFRTAFIQIAGAWEGAVACISSDALIRRAAAKMFGMNEGALTVELLHDAFGELTNMIGGSLKSLLPGPSVLCLPAVIEGSDYSICIPSARPVVEAAFSCRGQPFTVKLLAGGPPEALTRNSHTAVQRRALVDS